MLSRWLIFSMLIAVLVGHSPLTARVFKESTLWPLLGLPLIWAPIVLMGIGSFAVSVATTKHGRRYGWAILMMAIAWHIVLDAAYLALRWLGGIEGELAGSLAVAVSAIFAGQTLRPVWWKIR